MQHDITLRTTVVLIASIAALASTYLASSAFAPIAFALFIMALAWPLQSRLQSLMPRLLALAIVMLVIVVVFVVFASLIAWGFGRVARSLVDDSARFQVLYEQLTV